MAWPDIKEDIKGELPEEQQDPPSGLVHMDMHHGNLVFGDPPTDKEHGIAPILKLIDFGSTNYEEKGERENIFSIGKVMLYLIYLEFVQPSEPPGGDIELEGKKIKSLATRVVPFPQEIDRRLITLVAAAMAENADNRPSLKYLFDRATREIKSPAEFYKNKPEEQDDAVSQIWKDIIYNAPTS
ncbi:hypothetical protein F4818DRAFT_456400 [Hypoxylon cercidicola]|nr:hypothetical protein F4818DRAFT_456400 [Hypoxylon cercidicola]